MPFYHFFGRVPLTEKGYPCSNLPTGGPSRRFGVGLGGLGEKSLRRQEDFSELAGGATAGARRVPRTVDCDLKRSLVPGLRWDLLRGGLERNQTEDSLRLTWNFLFERLFIYRGVLGASKLVSGSVGDADGPYGCVFCWGTPPKKNMRQICDFPFGCRGGGGSLKRFRSPSYLSDTNPVVSGVSLFPLWLKVSH